MLSNERMQSFLRFGSTFVVPQAQGALGNMSITPTPPRYGSGSHIQWRLLLHGTMIQTPHREGAEYCSRHPKVTLLSPLRQMSL